MEENNPKISEFQYITEKLSEIKENLRLFDERNCRKHQEILATTNQSIGKTNEQISNICVKVENLEKENIKVDGKIQNIFVYLTIAGTLIMIVIDIIRKRFNF